MSDEIRNSDDELFDGANGPEEEQMVDDDVEAAEPPNDEAAEPPADDPPPPTEPPTSSGPGGIGRRDVLKALATVPVLGALGYTALRRKGLAREERERLLAELGIEDEGAAVFSELETRTHPETIRIGIIGYGGEGASLVRSLGSRRAARPESRTRVTRGSMSGWNRRT